MDVQAEMEVTARVRKAAAEALMEAQDKLRCAEEASARLEKQLEEALGMEQVRQGRQGGQAGGGQGRWGRQAGGGGGRAGRGRGGAGRGGGQAVN